jgi:hypothetical protein
MVNYGVLGLAIVMLCPLRCVHQIICCKIKKNKNKKKHEKKKKRKKETKKIKNIK